ncbi:MAG: phosphatidate cytidylyltransferase [Candidatus Babeliales bacterium]
MEWNFFLRALTGFIFALTVFSTFFLLPSYCFSLLLTIFFFYIFLFEWPQLTNNNPFLYWLGLIFYLIIPFICLIILNESTAYRPLVALTFVIAFSNDTVAYLVGKHWGIHKISPQVSPKKTWEGFFAGCSASIISFGLFHKLALGYFDVVFTLFLGFLLAVTAFLSDLLESYLKRKANIKDSGHILPGHGGLLDRLDSSLFLAIIIFILKNFLI